MKNKTQTRKTEINLVPHARTSTYRHSFFPVGQYKDMEQPSTTIGGEYPPRCFQAGGTELQYTIIAPSDFFLTCTCKYFLHI